MQTLLIQHSSIDVNPLAFSGTTLTRTSHAFIGEFKSRSESSCKIAMLYGWKWISSWRILLTEQSESLRVGACLQAERRGDRNIAISHCLNDLRWSNGPENSSPSPMSELRKKWFFVRDKGQWGKLSDSERHAGLRSWSTRSKSRPQLSKHTPHCFNHQPTEWRAF